MSKTVIDELVTILGIEMDSNAGKVVKVLGSSLDSITQFAKTAGIALTAAATSISYFVQKTSEASRELYNFEQLTNISTRTLQGWQFAADMAGGNADSLKSDLMSLTNSMSSPIPGEFNHTLFMMGISVRNAKGELKSADQVLLDVSDKFRGMSRVEQLQWGSRLGLSQDTIILLQQGRRAIEDYKKQAEAIPTIVDEKHIKMARDFNIQLKMLQRIFSYITQTAASVAGPILKGIVKDISEFLRMNQELIKSGLQLFIEGVIRGFVNFWDTLRMLKDGFFSLFPAISTFLDSIKNVESIAQIVFVILGAIAVAIAVSASGFILLAAEIAAAIIVLDDIITYFRGGESVIGNFIEKIKSLYRSFAESFPHIAELTEIAWQALKKFGSWSFDKLLSGLSKVYEFLLKIKEFISDITLGFMKAADNWVGDLLKGDWMQSFKKTIGFSGDEGKLRNQQNIINNNQQNNRQASQKNEIHINQQISGNSSSEVADETALKTKESLMNIFPGGLTPSFQ